jgi:predicted Zn-dependent protease
MASDIEQLAQRWKEAPGPETTVALCNAMRGPAHATLIQQVGDFARTNLGSNVPVLISVARMYMSAQRLSEAQGTLVTAGKLAPRDAAVYRVLGECLLRRGDADRAEKVLERAIHFGATDPDSRLWLERSRVFKPMQAKAGNRAVAAEIERTAPADAPATNGHADLLPARPPMDSFPDQPTNVRDRPAGLAAKPLPAPGPKPLKPPAAKAPAIAAPPPLPMSTGESHPQEAKAGLGARMSTQEPPQEELPRIGRYSKDADTASIARAALPLIDGSPGPADENSIQFNLGAPPPAAESAPNANASGPYRGASEKGTPDARDVLDALALAGVFEPPTGVPAVLQWDKPNIKQRRRTAIALVVMTAVAAGSMLGIFQYVHKKRAAQHLAAETVLARIEDNLHAAKLSSIAPMEQDFSQVFELDSRSPRAAQDWLRERALVGLLNGGKDIAFEDGTTRAIEVGLKEENFSFAQLAGFLFQGDTAGGAALLPRFDGPSANDAWYQLLAGATLERAGDPRAIERYATALKLDPDLFIARIALTRTVAIDGDPQKAVELAKDIRARYPDRAEGLALMALAWARDPTRTDQAPKEADDALTRETELPVGLLAIPHAVAAVRALDKHDLDLAKAEVERGLQVADSPGVASWLGSIAIATGDEPLARRAALVAVQFSAVYAPARVLAARVALLGDRLDEALKATEELDAASPDVAIVRGAVAYEQGDADGLARALDALAPDARKLPVLAPLVMGQDALASRETTITPDRLSQLADDDSPWADLVSMDIALDTGNLPAADKIAAAWGKPTDATPPLRALRLARLARYENRLDDADSLSQAAIASGTVTLRSLSERVFTLAARDKAGDATPLLAKYPLVLGPLATWLSAYAAAANGHTDEARAKVSSVDPPPDLAPLPAKMIAGAALGKMADRRRGPSFIHSLIDAGAINPDVAAAANVFGIHVPSAPTK